MLPKHTHARARAPSYLQQKFDPLDGGHGCFGDSRGDSTCQEILQEADDRVTHGAGVCVCVRLSVCLSCSRAHLQLATRRWTLQMDEHAGLRAPHIAAYLSREEQVTDARGTERKAKRK